MPTKNHIKEFVGKVRQRHDNRLEANTATPSKAGMMSAADKVKLNAIRFDFESGTLSVVTDNQTLTLVALNNDSSKFLRGDGTWGRPSAALALDTIPIDTDGGLWLDITDNKPLLKLRYGDSEYVFAHNKVHYVGDVSPYLACYLPGYRTSEGYDLAGNVWTVVGAPYYTETHAIKGTSLQFDGSTYLTTHSGITLGGQDFTIDGWTYVNSSTGSYGGVFRLFDVEDSTAHCIGLHRFKTTNNVCIQIDGVVDSTNVTTVNNFFHFAIVYQHSAGTLTFFLNGTKVNSWSANYSRYTYPYLRIGKSNFAANGCLVGSLDEFRIIDGLALWKEDFIPPVASDYPA